MRPAVAMLVAAAVALVPGAALAEAGTLTLDVGEEATVLTLTLQAGDVVEYTWSAGSSVRFTVERAGTELFSTTGQVGQGTFTAPSNGPYRFSFRNEGSFIAPMSWTINRRTDWSAILLVGLLVGVLGAALAIGLWQRRRRMAPIGPPPPPPR